MESLSAFDFFCQEASHDDVEIRQRTIDQISLILSLMGSEKVISDMIPWLIERLSVEMDQVHLVLATKLKTLVDGCDGGAR